MSSRKPETFPIRLAWETKVSQKPADVIYLEDSLPSIFATIAKDIGAAHFKRFGDYSSGMDSVALLSQINDFIHLMTILDAEYGPDNTLPVVDIETALEEAQRAVAELSTWLPRIELDSHESRLQSLHVGFGLWAIRHSLTLNTVAPLVNALAERANQAGSRQETAAVFALMQGVLTHVEPALSVDLERSNPERPWRILNLNFAITAIRSGDVAMMRYAFDTLNKHLPDERHGFYEQAYALALQPGFPLENRQIIEDELIRWTRPH